jgi:hypothetical protein
LALGVATEVIQDAALPGGYQEDNQPFNGNTGKSSRFLLPVFPPGMP